MSARVHAHLVHKDEDRAIDLDLFGFSIGFLITKTSLILLCRYGMTRCGDQSIARRVGTPQLRRNLSTVAVIAGASSSGQGI